jgi:hypothetical protein
VLLALLAPPGTLLHAVPSLDLVLRSAVAHLVMVSVISACALAVAVAAATAAGRSRDGSLVLLALGCLVVGFLMLAHGLVTPGIGGRPANLWVERLPSWRSPPSRPVSARPPGRSGRRRSGPGAGRAPPWPRPG